MKAGRRRNRQSRKHRAARVNWTPLPVVGKTMTANSAPFHEFKSEYQSGLVEKSQSYIGLELDCPSYDFRDIDISPTCLG